MGANLEGISQLRGVYWSQVFAQIKEPLFLYYHNPMRRIANITVEGAFSNDASKNHIIVYQKKHYFNSMRCREQPDYFECCFQVCEGCASAARIFSAYVAHAHASATGLPPPAPLPEHQAASTSNQGHTTIPGESTRWLHCLRIRVNKY